MNVSFVCSSAFSKSPNGSDEKGIEIVCERASGDPRDRRIGAEVERKLRWVLVRHSNVRLECLYDVSFGPNRQACRERMASFQL